MATKIDAHAAARECWHSIQKSYECFQSGLSMLEHAESQIETLIQAEGSMQSAPDRLGFGRTAQEK
jgi:hypothetical protein